MATARHRQARGRGRTPQFFAKFSIVSTMFANLHSNAFGFRAVLLRWGLRCLESGSFRGWNGRPDSRISESLAAGLRRVGQPGRSMSSNNMAHPKPLTKKDLQAPTWEETDVAFSRLSGSRQIQALATKSVAAAPLTSASRRLL